MDPPKEIMAPKCYLCNDSAHLCVNRLHSVDNVRVCSSNPQTTSHFFPTCAQPTYASERIDAISEERREHNSGRNIMRNCLLTANRATSKIPRLNLRENNIGFCVHRPSNPSPGFCASKCQAIKDFYLLLPLHNSFSPHTECISGIRKSEMCYKYLIIIISSYVLSRTLPR